MSSLRFFIDRNISVHLARMLSHFDRENTILHQDDSNFDARLDDPSLIRAVAAMDPKWVWVSADINQVRREPVERLALADSGMHAVFFRPGFNNQKPVFQAIKLISAWQTIVYQCRLAKVPSIFMVSDQMHNSKVEKYGNSTDLARR